MKISIIHHFGGLGGGLISCLDVAKMLVDLGNDVEVYISNPDQQVRTLFADNGIKLKDNVPEIIELTYHNASSNALIAILKSLKSYKNCKLWMRFFEELDTDLIIFNSLVQSPMIPLAKKAKKKCILFIRETIRGSSNTMLNKLLKSFLNHVDAVVYLTEYDKESWGLSDSIKQFIVPDIVNSDYFESNLEQHERKESKTTFIYLGGFSRIKGALDVLLAFEKFIKKGNSGQLYMLGGTYEYLLNASGIRKIFHKNEINYMKECFETVNRINSKEKKVHVIGLTTSTEKWYLLSDVIVFPVNKVHQARPVYEAGYFGKTVILPEYDNFAEAVVDKYNGLYYKKNSIEDLCDKMEQISSDTKLCELMSQRNKELYEKNHSYIVGMKALEKVVSEI